MKESRHKDREVVSHDRPRRSAISRIGSLEWQNPREPAMERDVWGDERERSPQRNIFYKIRSHVWDRLGCRTTPHLRRCYTIRSRRQKHEAESSAVVQDFQAWPSNTEDVSILVWREMEKLIKEHTGWSNAHLISNRFVEAVMRAKCPTDLRFPSIKTYMGHLDPKSHVNAYYGSLIMMGLSDAVIYKVFSTLGGWAAN